MLSAEVKTLISSGGLDEKLARRNGLEGQIVSD